MEHQHDGGFDRTFWRLPVGYLWRGAVSVFILSILMKAQSQFRIGVLASVTLTVALAADLGARLLPVKWFAFRAWEAAQLLPSKEGGFTPDFVYDNPASYGDLASLYNLPAMRDYRRERFTTDVRGFRNPEGWPPETAPRVVLFGDSFAAGCGVADADILSEQITRQSGIKVFNASHWSNNIDRILQLLDRLGVRNGTVIFQLSETFQVPEWPQPPDPIRKMTHLLRFVLSEPQAEQASYYVRCLRNLADYSPVEILSRRAYRFLESDGVLPNSPARDVVLRQLVDGKEMLFLLPTAKNYDHPPDVHPEYLIALDRALRSQGNRLLVMLVPDKFAVYAPYMQDPPHPPRMQYLDHLESAIRDHSIPVINLLDPLREAARKRLMDHEYLYFPDDTHWNAIGISQAAQFSAEALIKDGRSQYNSPIP
jgi:hypothetical protein